MNGSSFASWQYTPERKGILKSPSNNLLSSRSSGLKQARINPLTTEPSTDNDHWRKYGFSRKPGGASHPFAPSFSDPYNSGPYSQHSFQPYPPHNGFPPHHFLNPSQSSYQQHPNFRQQWDQSAQSFPQHPSFLSQQTPLSYPYPPLNTSSVLPSSQGYPGYWTQPASGPPLTSQQPANPSLTPAPYRMSSADPTTYRTSSFVPGRYTPFIDPTRRWRTETDQISLANGIRTETSTSTLSSNPAAPSLSFNPSAPSLSFNPADPRHVAEAYGATAPDGSRYSTAAPSQNTEKPGFFRRLFGSSKNNSSSQPQSEAERLAQQYEDARRSEITVDDAMDMARGAYERGRQSTSAQHSTPPQSFPWEAQSARDPRYLPPRYSPGSGPTVSQDGTASTNSGYASGGSQIDPQPGYAVPQASFQHPPPAYSPTNVTRPMSGSTPPTSRPPSVSTQTGGGVAGNALLTCTPGPDGQWAVNVTANIDDGWIGKRVEWDAPGGPIAITVTKSAFGEGNSVHVITRDDDLSRSTQPSGFGYPHQQYGRWPPGQGLPPPVWDQRTQSWVTPGQSASAVEVPTWGRGHATLTTDFWNKVPNGHDVRSKFNTVMSMFEHGAVQPDGTRNTESGIFNVVARPLEGRSTTQDFYSRYKEKEPVRRWVSETFDLGPENTQEYETNRDRATAWALTSLLSGQKESDTANSIAYTFGRELGVRGFKDDTWRHGYPSGPGAFSQQGPSTYPFSQPGLAQPGQGPLGPGVYNSTMPYETSMGGQSMGTLPPGISQANEARLHKHNKDWTDHMNTQGTRPDGSAFTEADYFTPTRDRTNHTRWAQYDTMDPSAPERIFGLERDGLYHGSMQELGKHYDLSRVAKSQLPELESAVRLYADERIAEPLDAARHWGQLTSTAERLGARVIKRDENGQPLPPRSWGDTMSSAASTLATGIGALSTASKVYSALRPIFR